MSIKVALFDLGDTLWHFPSMPPVDVIRTETVGRVSRLLQGWGFEVTPERRLLARFHLSPQAASSMTS